MKIKSINHDKDTNTVTIFEDHKVSPIVCQALEARYDENDNLFYLILDRVIASDSEDGLWHVSTSFVTEVARSDYNQFFVKNNIPNLDVTGAMQMLNSRSAQNASNIIAI